MKSHEFVNIVFKYILKNQNQNMNKFIIAWINESMLGESLCIILYLEEQNCGHNTYKL